MTSRQSPISRILTSPCTCAADCPCPALSYAGQLRVSVRGAQSTENEAHDQGASADERPPGDDRPVGDARHGGADHPGGRRSPYWPRVIGVVFVIVAIQLTLPPSVTLGPLWLIPLLELVGIPLGIAIWIWSRPDPASLTDRFLGRLMAAYLCFLAAASALNAVLLLTTLLSGSEDSAVRLLFAGFGVLVINVFTFGLIYWWIDGGGPKARASGEVVKWDFQYPQQASGQEQASGQVWTPTMLDYFYTAYTNIIAFSPTDTMPLTHRVKMLFTLQSSISLVTILVTVSRAINMIPLG